VLVSADRAEHVPGCNMAFRREALAAIGGFDAAYTAAGDDVDVCWKLLDRGGEIGFAPAAQVFHHRRGTVRGYLRQQRGYGKAERMVAGRHPHRFNRLGQARWSGFIYGGARLLPGLLRPVVYHGPMGSGAFQGVVRRPAETTMGLVGALLPLLLLAGLLLGPLAIGSPWWLLAPAIVLLTLVAYGLAAALTVPVDHRELHPVRVRALAGLLHVLQPLVRTWGRLRARRLAPLGEADVEAVWTGDRLAWLADLSHRLRSSGCVVRASGSESAWDLLVGAGPFVRCHVTTAVCWGWVPQWRVSWRPD
jgi:O-antigen biosynthesis protein